MKEEQIVLNVGDQGSCSVESIESLESDITEIYDDQILDESLLDI